jgi:uncharacterized protein YuzE
MKITYDPEGDVLYIELRAVVPDDSLDVEQGVTAELDSDGHIVALEVLEASHRMRPQELANISYENLSLTGGKRRRSGSHRGTSAPNAPRRSAKVPS